MDIKKLIKEAHENAVERGFYDCPVCHNPIVNCIGAGQCDYDGTGCNPNDNCGEYEPICKICNGTGINPNRNIGELLMLIVSELGEALEAHRCNRFADWKAYEMLMDIHNKKAWNRDDFKIENAQYYFESKIKDTFEDEIADVFIRLFDLCGYLEIEPEIKEIPRIIPENIAEALLDMVSFCIVIHGIYKMPPINPDRVTEIKMAWLFSDIIKFCDSHNIPIEKHIKAKMAYNRTRPHKHGKEY